MDRSGFVRGTLAPREGMTAALPERRKRPLRTMADMGMGDMAGMAGMGASAPAPKSDAGMAGMPGMAGKKKGEAKAGMAGEGASMQGPDQHGPGNSVVAMAPKSRLDDPGTGLADMPWRVLVYNDLPSLVANYDRRPPEREIGLPAPVEDSMIHSFVLAEILEYRAASEGPDTFRWDIYGWIGGDRNRLWIKTESSQQLGGDKTGEGDLQLLYGRLIAPFWDFQIGARVQQSLGAGPRNSRTYAVIGVQGMAPYLFAVEPSLFISDRGDVSARLTVSFDWLLTQKLVLQPRFEANAAV